MKRELSSHEIDRLLAGARDTWKAENERDDSLDRKPSERRLREPAGARRWTMRDVTPIALCALACVVIGLLLRTGSVPKESIRPEALLTPPKPPVVAPAEPAPEATTEAAASTSLPARPKPTATQPHPATPAPPSTLPQLPKVEPPPDTRVAPPAQPRSIKSFFEPDGTPVPPIPPRPNKHRHPRFGPEGPPGPPPHMRGKGRIHSL